MFGCCWHAGFGRTIRSLIVAKEFRDVPVDLGIEKCRCGDDVCNSYMLTGVRYVDGAGLDKPAAIMFAYAPQMWEMLRTMVPKNYNPGATVELIFASDRELQHV